MPIAHDGLKAFLMASNSAWLLSAHASGVQVWTQQLCQGVRKIGVFHSGSVVSSWDQGSGREG